MKSLTAYDSQGNALFYRLVKDKHRARIEVLMSGFLSRVDIVKYNGKKYNIKNVYKGW